MAAILVLVSLPLASLGPSTSVPRPPLSCNDQLEVWGPGYGYGSNESSQSLFPVLLMQPNTTGYVCVTYQSAGGSTSADPNPLSATGLDVRYDTCNAAGFCGFWVQSRSFVITQSLLSSTLPFVGNATVHYVSAIYSLTATDNSTGFYEESAPLPPCNMMPLAVGEPAAQLSASDFTQYYGLVGAPHPCFRSQFVAVEVGVIGMQVANVEF